MTKRILCFLFSLILSITGVKAQHNFHPLVSANDLSDPYVCSILQDSYGVLWIATLDGLNRYDGYHFRKYSLYHLGIQYNGFQKIQEDAKGTIWITNAKGFYTYDRANDIIRNNSDTLLASYGLPKQPKLVHVTDEGDLVVAQDDSVYFHSFSKNKTSLQRTKGNGKVLALCSFGAYTIVLTQKGMLLKVNWASKDLTLLTNFALPQTGDIYLYCDNSNRVWCFDKYSNFLTAFDIFRGKEIDVSAVLHSLNNDFVRSIIDDGNGTLWIGTNASGIRTFDSSLHLASTLRSSSYESNSLPTNHMATLYKGKEDLLWVGTSKHGVVFTQLNALPKRLLRTVVAEDISFFVEDEAGNIWIGYDGGGLARYKADGTLLTAYSAGQSGLPTNTPLAARKGPDGRLWFSSYGKGLFYWDGSRFAQPSFSASVTEGISFCRDFRWDKNGNLWVATFRHGVYCITKDGKERNYNKDNSSLVTNSVNALTYSAFHDRIYIGSGIGLHELNPKTGKIVEVNLPHSSAAGPQGIYVSCLFSDRKGMLWIGTTNGVYTYDASTGNISHLTTENGLSNNYVRAIIADNFGDIWVSTARGYTHINKEGNKYICHSSYENTGSGATQFNPYAIYCTNEGEILIGTHGNILKIKPEHQSTPNRKHKVYFTELYLNNQRISVGEKVDGDVILEQNILLTDKLTLSYDQNNIALEVSALDYGNEGSLTYSYRLNDNGAWVDLEGNRIYLSQMAPGHYKLQVRVKGEEGEDEGITTLEIYVRPPFWLSTPAWIFYILLLVFCVVDILLYYRRRSIRRFNRQKREMEIRQRQETDEMKMQFFTNISHDLRTPLTLISAPLDRIMKSKESKPLATELELIKRNVVIMKNEIDQVLDFNKLDHVMTRLNMSLGNLAYFVEDLCSNFQRMAPRSDIQLRTEILQPDIETAFDRDKMQRVIYNLLSNAYKYNVENGNVVVTVNQEGENAIISVADTGIGIKNKKRIFERFYQEDHEDKALTGNGIGLHIVHEYVLLHHGKIEIEDNQPRGTVFCITLPIEHQEQNQKVTELQPLEQDVQSEKHAGKTPLLIVDDNEDFRQFLASCLKEHYVVYTAANGQDALNLLDKHDVHLVISDVMMPVMDGLQLCRAIKTDIRYSHIPIILLTARVAKEHVVEGLTIGADDYIAKPFDIDILMLKIQKMLSWMEDARHKITTIDDVAPDEITVSQIDSKLISMALEAIDRNLTNSEYSVEQLSHDIGVSRSGLYKKMQAITGLSPIEFIRQRRIVKGKKILDAGETYISQVAYQVGLSPKVFAKYFKEAYGVLPSEYKSRNV